MRDYHRAKIVWHGGAVLGSKSIVVLLPEKYGDIVVGQDGDHLTIDFKSTPHMLGSLDHWQHDSFVTHLTDKAIEPAFVTFALDLNGHVSHVTLKPVSPTADFSFDYQDLDFTPIGSK